MRDLKEFIPYGKVRDLGQQSQDGLGKAYLGIYTRSRGPMLDIRYNRKTVLNMSNFSELRPAATQTPPEPKKATRYSRPGPRAPVLL